MKKNTLIKIKNAAFLSLLESGISLNEAAVETDILMDYVFGVTKKDLILNPDTDLPKKKLEIFHELIEKRINEKIPVQYLVKKAFFMGEEFYVDENVLIPRPETELLVEEVLKLAGNPARIIDIGTGSGCIACLIAKKTQNSVFAVDISLKALNIAELNAGNLGVKDKITFLHSDLFESIDSEEKFDIIVSNPPYIPLSEKDSLQPEVVLHEPHSALFADDEKGVSFYEKLALYSKIRLSQNGYLAVEIGINQAKSVLEIFKNAGFIEIKVIKDYNQIERIIIGKS